MVNAETGLIKKPKAGQNRRSVKQNTGLHGRDTGKQSGKRGDAQNVHRHGNLISRAVPGPSVDQM
jgi:hypothetical protein